MTCLTTDSGKTSVPSVSTTTWRPPDFDYSALLFNLYMFPLGQIIHGHNVIYDSYAENTKIYLSLSQSDYGPRLYQCKTSEQLDVIQFPAIK